MPLDCCKHPGKLLRASRYLVTLNVTHFFHPDDCRPPEPEGYELFEYFWLQRGPAQVASEAELSRFILTDSVRNHLKNLARVVMANRYPILLQVELITRCLLISVFFVQSYARIMVALFRVPQVVAKPA